MKITVNPMPGHLAKAEQRALIHFHPDTMNLIHARKRDMAQQVAAGGQPSAEFTQAAEIEGLTPQKLAETILAKPDELMVLENSRRALVLRLRAAKTKAELDQILAAEGVYLKNMVSDLT